MRLTKPYICAAMLCCLLAACSGHEKKWEPEVAFSLASFEVDISKYVRVDSITCDFFEQKLSAFPDLQKSSLKNAIISLENSPEDKPAWENLPISLDNDKFLLLNEDYVKPGQPSPDPKLMLRELMDNFRNEQQAFAANHLAYEILSEIKAQDTSFNTAIDMLFANRIIPRSTRIEEHIDSIVDEEKTKQVQRMMLQVFVNYKEKNSSKAPVANATIQSYMLDGSRSVLDSLLYTDGENGVSLSSLMEKEKRIIREYNHLEAQKLLPLVKCFVVTIHSDSLGIKLDDVRNLHNLKIDVSVSAMLKIMFNDAVEE
ncbi:MAG: hypothetical protein LBH84_01950 [Prevotellaceae bacterium]|jgi:hypothetical protein|nr:hypothetical protein [Prevotellaceae bacterium]